jgi:hypothetical protein
MIVVAGERPLFPAEDRFHRFHRFLSVLARTDAPKGPSQRHFPAFAPADKRSKTEPKRCENGSKTEAPPGEGSMDISELLKRKPTDREFMRKRFAHLLWAMAPHSRGQKSLHFIAGHCPL